MDIHLCNVAAAVIKDRNVTLHHCLDIQQCYITEQVYTGLSLNVN